MIHVQMTYSLVYLLHVPEASMAVQFSRIYEEKIFYSSVSNIKNPAIQQGTPVI